MARINYPSIFSGWVKLFKEVKVQVLALVTPNPIDNFLTEESINLTADETDVNNAVIANDVFGVQEKLMEEKTEQANNLFKTPWDDHQKCVQFLKKLYRSAVHKLGDWGVTIDAGNRVKYPADFAGRKKCVTDLIAKHNTFPVGTSPLQPFLDEDGITLATNLADTNNAALAFAAQDAAQSLKEQKREERDLLMEPVKKHLRGIGGVTVTWYASAPKKAGSIGFEIDDSPKGFMMKEVIIKEGSQKVVYDALVQSVVKNKSKVDLPIYKGKSASGTPLILPAGGSMLLPKGYSNFIIKNNSLDEKGIVQLTLHK